MVDLNPHTKIVTELPIEEKSIALLPYHFNYCVLGTPTPVPILFLHGFLGNRYEFLSAMGYLFPQAYSIAIDLPGHGNTRVMGDEIAYTMPHTAKAIIRFLEELNIRKSILVGYSMGGRLALYLALHFPDYFDRVILESASPGLKTEVERTQRQRSDRELCQQFETLNSQNFPLFLQQWYRKPLFASLRDHPNFPEMWQQRLQNTLPELAKSLRQLGLGQQPSLWDRLAKNTIPFLLLVGELDLKFRDINQEIYDRCPNTKLVIVEQSGHNIHLEKVERFVKEVQDFIVNIQVPVKIATTETKPM